MVEFKFEKNYDLIWIQWAIQFVKNDDLCTFLANCKNALGENV